MRARADSYDEIAQMLSYSIADIPPDAQLTAAAAAGQLADPAQRTMQADCGGALSALSTNVDITASCAGMP